MAEVGDGCTDSYSNDGVGDGYGGDVNTGLASREAPCGLEIKGQVVAQDAEGHDEKDGEQASEADGTLGEDVDGHKSPAIWSALARLHYRDSF